MPNVYTAGTARSKRNIHSLSAKLQTEATEDFILKEVLKLALFGEFYAGKSVIS
jgi:hypothetical protein